MSNKHDDTMAMVWAEVAKAQAKKYTDAIAAQLTEAFSGGLKFKGAVDYYENLPQSPKIGDAYTVLYTGSSGTEPDGTEYAWGKVGNTNQWIPIGPDLTSIKNHMTNADIHVTAAQKQEWSAKIGTDDYSPVEKTAAMTQDVGKGSDGKLYTAPGGTEANAVHYTADSGKTDAQKSQARTNINAMQAAVVETYTIAAASWTSMSGNEPFAYSTEITATHTIGTDTVCELVNNNAVSFATYGFAIGEVAVQSLKLFALEEPEESVTLEVDYYG